MSNNNHKTYTCQQDDRNNIEIEIDEGYVELLMRDHSTYVPPGHHASYPIIALSAEQARTLAKDLIEMADKVDDKGWG